MQNPVFLRPALLALLASATVFSACKKDNDDPTPDDDNEQITTVTYTLTPQSGGAAVTIQYRDPDGDGGQAGVITPSNLVLAPNTTYTGTLALSDETKTPAEDVTAEIREKSDEHLFVFTPSNVNLTVTATDRDKNNLPIGLATQVVTGAANATGTTGNLKVVLRHQPGAKNGTATPGSTDVEVDFPTAVR